MADQYLTISTIARDMNMQFRVIACAAQQNVPGDPAVWTMQNSYDWAASPGWAEKWDYAVAGGVLEPGADPAVITDLDILTQVQSMNVSPE